VSDTSAWHFSFGIEASVEVDSHQQFSVLKFAENNANATTPPVIIAFAPSSPRPLVCAPRGRVGWYLRQPFMARIKRDFRFVGVAWSPRKNLVDLGKSLISLVLARTAAEHGNSLWNEA
jgi:hypothetical protein